MLGLCQQVATGNHVRKAAAVWPTHVQSRMACSSQSNSSGSSYSGMGGKQIQQHAWQMMSWFQFLQVTAKPRPFI
jgi:hypothetical protein